MRQKTVAIVSLVAVMSLLVIVLTGCGGGGPTVLGTPSTPPTTVEQYDLSVVVTLGNHSFVPLDRFGKPADHVNEVLGALWAFEKAHPELEITGWSLEKQQSTYTTSNRIFGIWVDHRPVR